MVLTHWLNSIAGLIYSGRTAIAKRRSPGRGFAMPLYFGHALGHLHSVSIEQLEDRALLSVTQLGVASAQYANSTTLSGFTVNAGNDRLLIVAVSDPNTISGAAPSDVTFNGLHLTQGTSVNDGASASDAIWYLKLGSSVSSTSGTIVVTTTGTAERFIGAVAYAGVDQTTPVVAGPNDHDANGDNATSSINVTSKVGDLVFDLFDAYKQAGVNSVTVGGGQTIVHNQSGAIAAQGFAHYLTSSEPGAPTVNMSWNSEASGNGSTATLHASVNLNQSLSGPAVNLSVDKTTGTEAGTTVVTVTATAASAVSGAQTVNLAVSGTGVTAGDYSLSNNVITIPNGAMTGSVTFTVVDDAVAEGAETARLTISGPSAGILLGATTFQDVAITDNDTDVAVTKTDGVNNAIPGGAVTYTIIVSNPGPTAAPSTSLTDNFPAFITSTTWTSIAVGGATGNSASGSGNISQTLDLPAGSSVTYTVSANISASATGMLVNTATVFQANDTNPGNNSATDTDNLTPQTDVAVTKTDAVNSVVPGQSTTYTIVVTNSGPSVATSTTFTDNFPAGIISANWTSVAAGGATGNTASSSGNISQTLNLPTGSSVTYTVTANVSPGATGSLANTATVSHVNDTNGGNNSDTDTDTLTPQTDVSVTKTDGVNNATPGFATIYTIVVGNSGPSNAVSTTFTDNFPTAVTSATWTSVTAGGATGNTASSAGNIAEILTLPPGATVTYTVIAIISSGATGNLVNTATVSQADDNNLGNNAATDTDTLGNPVSITKILDGAEPSTNGKFRVSQLQATGTDTVLTYTVTGTAADGTDFTSLTGSVTITAGDTSADIDVFILDDTVVDGDETVVVTLTGFTQNDPAIILDPVLANRTATVDIADDDTNTLSISAPTITETNVDQAATFTVTSPVAVQGGFDVDISYLIGTASDSDFSLVTTTVHFNGTAGETQPVSVTIKGDTVVEANETFQILLGSVTAGSLSQAAEIISTASATGTIINDDANLLSISAPVITETNADQLVTFTVTSPNAVDGGFDVAISTTSGTAAAFDFALVTTTVHFSGTAGETQSVSVTIKGDTIVEANETFDVVLGTVSGTTATQVAAITSGASATGTIINDDTNLLSISAPVITETNADQLVTFTVTSPNAVEGGFDVAISTTNGTAGASDFSLLTTTVHFNGTVGEMQSVSVTIKGDTIVEANETFDVVLGTVSGTTATQVAAITSGASATGTIINDDTNLLSISAPVITETNADQLVTFTVTSPNVVEGGFDVAISTTNGTAGVSDFTLVTTTVHFSGTAGETQLVSVTIKGDTIVEANETFNAVLGTVSGTTVTQVAAITSGASAAGTIINDDANLLSITAPVITETNADQLVTFTVTSPNAVEGGFDMAISAADGTAESSDYALVTTTIHFTGNANETQSVSVTIKGDAVVEANETFSVTLGTVSNSTATQIAAITSGATATGTINNDDSNILTISGPASITETNVDQTATFTITSPTAVQGGFDVAITTNDGSAGGGDYALVTTTVHFNGTVGETHSVNVTIKGDTIVEANETFTVSPGTVSGTSPTQAAAITGTGVIATINNDDVNTLSISAPAITESNGDQIVTFTVTSPNAVEGGFDVALSTTDGTAGSGDYALISTSVHFNGTVGESKLVSVTIKGDTVVEANETFSVNLGAVSNTTATQIAAITTGASANATINNDDTNTLSISAPVITETNVDQTVKFIVTSPNAVQGGFDVAISAANGTAGSSDYALVTTTVHFTGTAGETQLVNVTIKGDTLLEANETFQVSTGTVSGTTATQQAATTSGATATGVILNDDVDILTISAPVITETNGDQIVTFTVTSPTPVPGGFDVALNSTDGTAGSGDYTLLTTSLHFNGTANETLSVNVRIKGDAIVENHETFRIGFGAVTGTTPTQASAIITTNFASGTIQNDDSSRLSISPPAITETNGDQVVTFSVTSSNAVEGGFDVAIGSASGTATSNDFSLVTKSIHFNGAAGETQLVSVTIKGDTIVESDETFRVILGTVSGTTETQRLSIVTGASATATILDDDVAPLTISAPVINETTSIPRRVNFPLENSTVQFTVTSLSAVPGGFDVAILTSNGTAGTADYSLVTKKVHFQGIAGETRTITVEIVADAIVEDDETFTVTLGAISNTTAAQQAKITTGASATGVIVDDDRQALIIEAPTITESNSDQIVTFTITSLNAVQGGFDLDLSTLDGTADSSDYSLVTKKVHFTGVANEKQLVQVTIKGDTLLEANETFKVVLGAVSNTSAKQKASISTGASATGTIKNDDRAASANKVARQALKHSPRRGG